MASLCTRILFRNIKYNYAVPCRTLADRMIPNAWELATGKEKREMEAYASGNDDPYDMKFRTRGPGTKEEPNIVTSVNKQRIVGCICDEDSNSISWMWVHLEEPKRCRCGYWFKLVVVDQVV